MNLSAGTRLGPYEILAPIGAGGMGEVYRGRDTKLDREIAIKVLPAALARDPERLARFEREAKVLASLNHPNIAQIYGVEESDGVRALVMELVPGETLKGPLPLERALNYARQIADALEAAHDKGIIHRDLKPANIMITPQGVVKVLDFGLAAVSQPPGTSSGDPNNSPTLTMQATQAGMILGTAGYMAPEQAAGQAVDKRADIWSFGVVLWEMLTGQRLFTGETVSHILAAVLTRDPDLTRVPLKVRPLLERCLEKDPKKRLRDIGDAWPLLESAPSGPATAASPETGKSSRSKWGMAWGAAGILIALGAVSFDYFRQAPPTTQGMRLSIDLPENALVASFALSPDGRTLVLSAVMPPGEGQLYLRSLDSTELRPISGTNAARTPFWSPDGRSIGFIANSKLKVVSAGGGPVQTLCDSGLGTGTWSRDGVILFSSSTTHQIMRASASGGACTPVLTPEGGADYRVPVFHPDGRRFFYASMLGGDSAKSGVFVAELDHPKPRRLLPDVSGVVFVPPASGSRLAHLLFLRETTLMAQPLDPETLQLAGDPFAVAAQASTTNSPPQLAATVSADGTLVYLANLKQDGQLAWYDRAGKVLGKIGAPTMLGAVSLSPDGKTAAASRLDLTGARPIETWLHDLDRNVESRLTDAQAITPVWSPDGTRIAFYNSSQRNMYLKEVTGGREEPMVRGRPSDWSSDGRFLLYTDVDAKNQGDIWILPDPLNTSGPRRPIPYLQTPFEESQAQFSPDGHWVAYTSNESGRYEVFLRPFPTPASGSGVKWQVSSNGGQQPRWRRDGKELFYLELALPRMRVMAMPVSPAPRPIATGATPKALFDFRGLPHLPYLNEFAYSASADGQRFLVGANADQDVRPTLNVLVNWPALVKK